MEGFQPRSFNMGIHRKVFEQTGGFKFDRFAEDIEFSIRMRKSGFKISYITDAFVYHKRRTSFKQFFWQVYNFGRGRVLVGRVHADAIKLTHIFPSVFLLGIFAGLIALILKPSIGFAISQCYAAYFMAIGIMCYATTRSILVAIAAMPSAFVQLVGYGYGFMKESLNPTK